MFAVIDLKTGKYSDPCKIAKEEEWAAKLIYCDMKGFAIAEDGDLILVDECGNAAYCPPNRFKIVWEENNEQNVHE